MKALIALVLVGTSMSGVAQAQLPPVQYQPYQAPPWRPAPYTNPYGGQLINGTGTMTRPTPPLTGLNTNQQQVNHYQQQQLNNYHQQQQINDLRRNKIQQQNQGLYRSLYH